MKVEYFIQFALTRDDVMSEAVTKLESYAIKTVCMSASLTVLSYLAGAVVLYFLYPILGAFYLGLAVLTLIVSMKLRCTHCYYLGKYCNFGLGKLASFLFSKGDPSEFSDSKKVGITAIMSFGTMLIPVVVGLLLLVINLSIGTLGLLIGYILIGIVPNFLIRGDLCEKCMQGDLGCPSYDRMLKRKLD